MEEVDLLKERLQAITDKHRIQEDIRQKKLELDEDKLKLQHLKKMSLREQWLLQDSASHNATESPQQLRLQSDQQQTRQLQLSIHRIGKEVESLERQESIISTNENFILNRLKAVEKSSEDIIKEVQGSFVPGIPDVPECPSPTANKQQQTNFELNTPRKTLFAMEISVSKNLWTGESAVLSTAPVPPEELNQHSGCKVFDDDRKCVYALNSEEEPQDRKYVSELSANEVEQLLRSATVHRQANHPNYCQPHSRSKEIWFYSSLDEGDGVEGCGPRHQRGCHSNRVFKNNLMEKDLICGEQRPGRPGAEPHYNLQESQYRWQEVRNNHSNLRQAHLIGNHNGLGHYYGNQTDSSYAVRNIVQEDLPSGCHTSSIIRTNVVVNGGEANGCPLPKSHDQEVVSYYQPQLCYTPANIIPFRDYVSVEEDELYCFSSLSDRCHGVNLSTALCTGSAHSDRVPSPFYGEDSPYTILSSMASSEPITAIFMGFQHAHDDSGQGQEFEGSLKAELVIIEDSDGGGETNSMREKKKCSYTKEGSASGGRGHVEGGADGQTEGRMRPGIRKFKSKHKACCAVC